MRADGDFAAALSRRSIRVLHAVVDAREEPGPGPLDAAPGVERRIRWAGVGAARSTWLLLRVLEWIPTLTLREPRGFCWLPREERAALLARWRRARWVPGRPALRRLDRWIGEALEEAAADASPAPVRPAAPGPPRWAEARPERPDRERESRERGSPERPDRPDRGSRDLAGMEVIPPRSTRSLRRSL